ncbi:uncharacterized protein LOC106775402 isoform X3 [Vigna radiata var. radiata]|uniref:Uncharacterized protein LOC106775402 isoform X3 n=1 Tax=Vigna radiata var. radiata TaxID=3916 RepID=A0A3Q0FFT4_VIGRR|nr:uncharacterized protein LOC106775402 isoform X3 [Vigna radiata var. radiata]
MASISPSSSNSTSTPYVTDLTKQLRLHEVALAELNNHPSSRVQQLQHKKKKKKIRGCVSEEWELIFSHNHPNGNSNGTERT